MAILIREFSPASSHNMFSGLDFFFMPCFQIPSISIFCYNEIKFYAYK
jgi:hypothetical protein